MGVDDEHIGVPMVLIIHTYIHTYLPGLSVLTELPFIHTYMHGDEGCDVCDDMCYLHQ